MAVAIGVIASPLVCGSLGGVGWLALGVWRGGRGGCCWRASIYFVGRDRLPPEDGVRRGGGGCLGQVTGAGRVLAAQLVRCCRCWPICFVGNNQVYNIYLVWARDNAALHGFPVTWLVSYDAADQHGDVAGRGPGVWRVCWGGAGIFAQ